jgi:hypothetical protein
LLSQKLCNTKPKISSLKITLAIIN